MKRLIIGLGFLSMGLTGCVELNTEFDCPMTKGGTCQRMDQVYESLHQGNSYETLKPVQHKNPMAFPGKSGDPLRFGEGVMRVWVAPYEDTDGNYHQASKVYSVVEEGRWIQNPPRAFR